MLAGPLSFRLRAGSSLNDTSSCPLPGRACVYMRERECRAFSISQWARTAAMKTVGSGPHDRAK